MPYIDGFVIACPEANKQKFIDHAASIDRSLSNWVRCAWSNVGETM
jgi:uncharacterized protein YbaA (DUF1428 family)